MDDPATIASLKLKLANKQVKGTVKPIEAQPRPQAYVALPVLVAKNRHAPQKKQKFLVMSKRIGTRPNLAQTPRMIR